MRRFPRLALALLAIPAASTFAAPIEPPAWVRGATPAVTALSESRTYQQWDQFGTPGGPNAPTPANPGSPTVPTFPASVNPNGTANVFDTTAATDGAGITSGGNLYSPTAATAPRAIVPLPAIDGFGELVNVQINVLGTGIDTASIAANGTSVSTLPLYDLTAVSSGSGFGAATFYTLRFLLPDAASLTLDYSAAGSSSSLDVIAIDTRSTVPEPASLAVLGLGAAGLLRRRR